MERNFLYCFLVLPNSVLSAYFTRDIKANYEFLEDTDDISSLVRSIAVIGRVQVQQVQVKYWIIKKCTLYFT